MKTLRRYLQQQFDYVADLDRRCDPDQSIQLEVGEIVEEARRQCCKHGFQKVGEVATSLSPRSALPILGGLLTWARHQKSKDDWLTPPQVAKMMGVKPDKVLHWIHMGELQAINVATKEGGRPQFAVTPADLDVFTMRRATQRPTKVKRARAEPCGKYHY